MEGRTAKDLWHLTIDDLLASPAETPRLVGPGPFVINLSTSTAPISIPAEGFPEYEHLRVYQVKQTDDGRTRYRLRLGLVTSELEADAILGAVRERYPSAFATNAADDDLRLAKRETERASQAAAQSPKSPAAGDPVGEEERKVEAPAKARAAPAPAPAPPEAESGVFAIDFDAFLPPIEPQFTTPAAKSAAPMAPVAPRRSRSASKRKKGAAESKAVGARQTTAPEVATARVPAPEVPTAKAPATKAPAVRVPAVRAPAVRVPVPEARAAKGPEARVPTVASPAADAQRAVFVEPAHDPNADTDQVAVLTLPPEDTAGEVSLDDGVQSMILAFEPDWQPELETELELLQPALPSEPAGQSVARLGTAHGAPAASEDERDLESVVARNNAMVDSLEARKGTAGASLPISAVETKLDDGIPVLETVADAPLRALELSVEAPTVDDAIPVLEMIVETPAADIATPDLEVELDSIDVFVDAAAASALFQQPGADPVVARAEETKAVAQAEPAPIRRQAPALIRPQAPAPRVEPQQLAPAVKPAALAESPPEMERAACPIAILADPLPDVDSTQTIRELTPLELADDQSSLWFAIQLSLSEDAVNPENVPHLDIFDSYRLYSVVGLDQGKFMHALRVGFFSEEGAAEMVAGYLRSYFEAPAVKRVSLAERERFADRRVVPRRDIGATGRHTIIELSTAPRAPQRRLADLTVSDGQRPSDSGSLWSRLVAPLKR